MITQTVTSFLGILFLIWAAHMSYLLYVGLQEGNLSMAEAGYNVFRIFIVISIVFVILS